MSNVTSPEEFFGFQLGSDRKIARWDKIVEYFNKLQEQSDKIKVIDMGPSTEDHPFLLCIISSAKNLKNLEKIRKNNNRLADPEGLSKEEVKKLIKDGKAVICQSMSLHATEIGGTQMAPELTYDLLSRDDAETKRILDNVVFLMVPCFNPDGQIMVTDWYNEWVGTEYEGTGLPWLYHKYVGHDNNRDAFQTNMMESKYMAKIMFQDWTPQHYVDHHHMGSYGPRLYVPPYAEPIHPHADPLIWREHSWYGSHMAYRLEEEGKSGIINGAQFLAWGHLGFHWITIYHNIAGTLTESASARLASPLYIHPSQLTGDRRGTLPTYDPQTNFPNPWPGGWWRLRDIVEQQKISAWAALDMAARNKDTALKNAYLKAKRQTKRGAKGSPAAYIIPCTQHDPLTTAKMVEKLLVQGIKIHVAREEFIIDDIIYPAGSYVVDCAQPKSGLVKTLLGQTIYPDHPWTRARDGSPLRPQDTATDTMFEYMGVRVDPVGVYPGDVLDPIEEAAWPEGCIVGTSRKGYALDCRINDSYTAVNRLLQGGADVSRTGCEVTCGDVCLPPGTFIVKAKKADLAKVAEDLKLAFHAVDGDMGESTPVKAPRLGMYQRYWGGNMDEGWTRFVLESFEFPYTTLMDEEIKTGDLKKKYDTIILPNDAEAMIMGKDLEEYYKKRFGGAMSPPNYPPEYRSGIGDEGVEALKKFVEEGGTLVCFDGACDFAISKLKLKLTNALDGLSSKEFFCPGSTLHACVDPTHPAAYGMTADSLLFFWNSQAFNIVPSGENDKYEVVATYPEREMLESGWLIGEGQLKRKAAMVVARHGEGKVVLIGFRPQHRAQTHGTYKLVFNSLYG
ncbi:peptidase M14 family protein [Candidatus Bathyarchaeota archaeon]|nr:peptidase M14 family protein [Candidatus Bathyarchaeota archaeon]